MKDASFSCRSGIHHTGGKHITLCLSVPVCLCIWCGFRFYLLSLPHVRLSFPTTHSAKRQILGQIEVVETRTLSGIPHRIS